MHRYTLHIYTIILILQYASSVKADYNIEIESDAPGVPGAVITFKATLYENNELASGSFSFEWQDDSILNHQREVSTTKPYDSWSVNYTAAHSPPGPYIMQVVVYKYYLFLPREIASRRLLFYLTQQLNGDLILSQSNKTVSGLYVSNNTELHQKIVLSPHDEKYLNDSATRVLTFWFVDCQYLGMTDNYELLMNYTEVNKEHRIEGLVLADHTPFPPIPTTTVAPTTTTTTTTTTSKPTTTTTKTTTIKPKVKRNASLMKFSGNDDIVAKYRGNILSLNATNIYNDSFPFVCNNNTIVPIATNISYGYFNYTIITKQPIVNVTVTGNNWIQHSDVLNISVSCIGSGVFNYCYTFKEGIYNITGNESCVYYDTSEKCEFPIRRFFKKDYGDKHTVVIIIQNDVSKYVYPVTVTIYKVTKQAQLSVIVVPVTFSLVAVVVIIFGIAYYFQNRPRFIVEVADFKFGQQYPDMEYKSFTERLRESFTNAFTRVPVPGGSSEGLSWPPNRKYDNMSN